MEPTAKFRKSNHIRFDMFNFTLFTGLLPFRCRESVSICLRMGCTWDSMTKLPIQFHDARVTTLNIASTVHASLSHDHATISNTEQNN